MSNLEAVAFTFDFPTRVHFGPDGIQLLATFATPASRPLLLAGRVATQRLGYIDLCQKYLQEAGAEPVVYSGLESNARYEQVLAAAETFTRAGCDCIVALGGGSVMDAARGVALAASHEGDIWDLRVTGPKSVAGIHETGIPITTIPTVAGTGAELSPAALITRDHDKQVFFSPYLFPARSIIDPRLTISAPPEITARTGIDAFIQGLEAAVSPHATPFSDTFALRAVSLAGRWLPRAVADGSDLTARTYMSIAAALSLFAINQAGVGGIHALSTPMSGLYGLHHGEALSIAALPVIEANWADAGPRFAEVAASLGLGDEPTDGLGTRFFAYVRELLDELRLPTSFRAAGIRNPNLGELSSRSQNPDMSTNPRVLTAEDVQDLLGAVL
jgi:alcohol dehydrogenase class IV